MPEKIIEKLHVSIPAEFYEELKRKKFLDSDFDNLVIELLRKHMEGSDE